MVTIVLDLLENPDQSSLEEVGPFPSRLQPQEEREQEGKQQEQQAVQHKQAPENEQHQRQEGEEFWEQQKQDEREHISPEFMEGPRVTKGCPPLRHESRDGGDRYHGHRQQRVFVVHGHWQQRISVVVSDNEDYSWAASFPTRAATGAGHSNGAELYLRGCVRMWVLL